MSNRIVFIDSHIANYQSLIAQLPQDTEAVLLDTDRDGIEQILAALQGRTNLTAIDILSHGSPGTITLGSGVLNHANIDNYAEQLKQIGQHLTEDGDILLYGCEVAKGETGQVFIERLSQLTGTDVAASINLTGATNLGGDWLLENQQGSIETTVLQNPDYQSTLVTGMLIAGDGSGNGGANGNPGGSGQAEDNSPGGPGGNGWSLNNINGGDGGGDNDNLIGTAGNDVILGDGSGSGGGGGGGGGYWKERIPTLFGEEYRYHYYAGGTGGLGGSDLAQ